MPRRPALIALVLFAFSDDLIYYSSELKPYSLDLAIGLAVSLAALDALGKPVSVRRAAVLALLAVAAPWFSFASAFVVAGCGATLDPDGLRVGTAARRRGLECDRDRLARELLCLVSSVGGAISARTRRCICFWDFAFLPVWPLPMDRARLAAAAGILLEIFVTPLEPGRPGLALGGRHASRRVIARWAPWSLARRSWPAWAILVLPIALAMVASAMKRYPLHGRLILELVPAFFS